MYLARKGECVRVWVTERITHTHSNTPGERIQEQKHCDLHILKNKYCLSLIFKMIALFLPGLGYDDNCHFTSVQHKQCLGKFKDNHTNFLCLIHGCTLWLVQQWRKVQLKLHSTLSGYWPCHHKLNVSLPRAMLIYLINLLFKQQLG